MSLLMCKATAFLSGSLVIRGLAAPRTKFLVEESRRACGLVAASPADQVCVHMCRKYGCKKCAKVDKGEGRPTALLAPLQVLMGLVCTC